MRRTVFCTVGTSLKGSWERKYPGQQSGTDEWIQLLREDEKCCAEKASLELLALDPPQEHLAFLSSDTEDGSQCAAALASYYQERGIPDSTVFRVPGLRGNFNEFQGSGLPNLIQKMASVYQQYPGMRFIINATGGYKAQTAYATLFGILMGIEVVYLHEDFRNLVRFPQMPLSFDSSLLENHGEILESIVRAPTRAEARKTLGTLPLPMRSFFQKGDDNYYTYSPLGEIFLARAATKRSREACPVQTHKSHSTIWGKTVKEIAAISDSQVRLLFQRIYESTILVTRIHLEEMVHSKSEETFLEFTELFQGALRYLLHTPYGSEYLDVMVVTGAEREVLARIGRKIYP